MGNIETAQANCSLSSSKKDDLLSVQSCPIIFYAVPTFFWADSFDTIVERLGGGGSVNVTHFVPFEEIVSNNIAKTRDSTVQKFHLYKRFHLYKNQKIVLRRHKKTCKN